MGGQVMMMVHGGAGHPAADVDGCVEACQLGMDLLKAGGSSLDAGLGAIVVMENDERFNAGTGADLGLDGRTIEFDAGLMDTRGKLAAVIGLQRVKNPILVVRKVADTPLKLLIGEGATRFARAAGFADYYAVSEQAREHHREAVEALKKHAGGDFPPEWHGYDFEKLWPYPASWKAILDEYGGGTVGAVCRDAEGHFAVCTSTGGSSPMILGRAGNTGVVGCGYFAGPKGAIAGSGIGEYFIQHMLCRTAYDWLAGGMPLQEALDRAIALIPEGIDAGLIGVSEDGMASSANTQFPVSKLEF